MDVTLQFNDFNFAPVLSTYSVSYETNYRKTVTALDGTEYFANATRRPVITFSLFPMTDAQATAAYDALSIMIADCTYTDPATTGDSGTDYTQLMRVTSNLDYVFALRSVDGNRYYKGGQITLRGVKCRA